MVATKTKKPKTKPTIEEPTLEAPAPVVETEAQQRFNAKLDTAAETLVKDCSEVRVRVNWFSTSAKVDKETALEMLATTEAERTAVSISKRLLSSKHEAIKTLSEAKSAILKHLHSWTLPMMALKLSGAAVGEDAEARKDAGIRLIQKKDMQVFDQRLQYLIGILKTAAETLQEKLPEIKAEDKARLGKLYRDSDYPKDVSKLVGVEVSYKPVGTDIDWEKICPDIYKREQAAARQKFLAVVETAASEFANRFVQYIQQVVDQLGNRVRLNPRPEHRLVEANNADGSVGLVDATDAEVLTKLTHADDPENVPAGHLWLQIRLKKVGAGRSTEVWLAKTLAEKDYHTRLMPAESGERKKLFASSIDNLKTELEAFVNIGSMLGPYQDKVSQAVADVRALLSRGSRELNSEGIVKELRDSNMFRTEMKDALEKIRTRVQDSVVDAKVVRRRIRKLEPVEDS